MGLIAFLIVGGVAGWLASTFMNKNYGLLMNLLVGIAGAYIGGFIGRAIGLSAAGLIGEIVIATAGAVILLWVLGKLKRA